MEQQVINAEGHQAHPSVLRARLQHWRSDAREAMSAVRKDYEQARKAVHDFGEHSEFRAFLSERFKADENAHAEAHAEVKAGADTEPRIEAPNEESYADVLYAGQPQAEQAN